MADLLPLIANASTLTTPGNISTYVFAQEIEHVVEVSGYDQIDAQFFLYNTVSDTDVKFSLLTSMIRSEKLDGWVSLGEFQLSYTGGPVVTEPVTFPLPVLSGTTLGTLPTPLLRYVRWKIEFVGGVTAATVAILGLVRRKAL